MRPRRETTFVRPEPILGKNPVRNAVILGLASAALLSCIITAGFLKPANPKPDPAAMKAAAEAEEARALRKLAATLRVSAEFWLKENLKDPDSLEVVQWSNPTETSEGLWLLSVKYRARNSFGGKTVEFRIFTFDSDANVLDSRFISRLVE